MESAIGEVVLLFNRAVVWIRGQEETVDGEEDRPWAAGKLPKKTLSGTQIYEMELRTLIEKIAMSVRWTRFLRLHLMFRQS